MSDKDGIPMVSEWCSHCNAEQAFPWDVRKQGYEAKCPRCGETLMLCDECQHGQPRPACDFDRETGVCQNSFIRRYPELAGYENRQILLPRNPKDTVGEQLSRYEIVFEADSRRYYCFVDATNTNEALGLFFVAHLHITFETVVDTVECGEGADAVPMILELNRFANLCGYFHNACLTDGVELNNGYNCRHEKQEEGEEMDGKWIGCCYAHSCPLAFPADYEDLVRHGVIDPEEYPAPEKYEEGNDYDYMIVCDEETLRNLRTAGETGLAER